MYEDDFLESDYDDRYLSDDDSDDDLIDWEDEEDDDNFEANQELRCEADIPGEYGVCHTVLYSNGSCRNQANHIVDVKK